MVAVTGDVEDAVGVADAGRNAHLGIWVVAVGLLDARHEVGRRVPPGIAVAVRVGGDAEVRLALDDLDQRVEGRAVLAQFLPRVEAEQGHRFKPDKVPQNPWSEEIPRSLRLKGSRPPAAARC